jgi:isopentenyl-diphosphate delta-isomerase
MTDGESPAGRRLREVCVTGEDTAIPVAVEELRARALEALPAEAADFVAGGAGSGETMAANERAFDDWQLRPRMLRDVSDRDLGTTVLGQDLPAPVLLAPIGMQTLLHEEAERATTRGAAAVDVPTVASSTASTTMEEVAEAAGETRPWFQLYASTDDAVTRSFLQRAEDAGYGAVVVTVDAPLMGWRERTLENGYVPFFDGHGLANYYSDPAFRDRLDAPPEEDEAAAVDAFTDVFGNPSLNADDLARICEWTDRPVLAKGILHPEDAREAIAAGAEGVVVSNHGGRQVDGAMPALRALPDVVDALPDATVLFDSGVRRGADVFTAVALGADAVLLGRPYCYGLALAGEAGVREVCKNYLADVDMTLALAGYTGWDEVDRSALIRSDVR